LSRAARAAGALALLAGAQCTEAGGGLVIMQDQVPDTDCSIPGEASEVRRANGVLDVALDRAYPYLLYPLVANNLPLVGEKGDVEPNRINVTGARVRIEAPPGVFVPFRADCPQQFDHPSEATLEPGKMSPLFVEAMRSCHAEIFRDMFRTKLLNANVAESIWFRAVVRARGLHGGDETFSGPFEFPIRVCYGCLQTGFQGDFAQFNFPQTPSCDLLGEHPFTGNPCGIAQDFGPVLCCAADAKGEKIECPARPRVRPPTTTP
jgi:hypothetical protein